MSCTGKHVAVAGHAVDLAPLPHPTRVAFAERVAQLVHREDITPGIGLEWLAAARLTGDDNALETAVEALATRDGLLDGSVDPYELLEVAPSVRAGVSMRDFAVAEQERALADAVEVLARPCDVRGARAVLADAADQVMAVAR